MPALMKEAIEPRLAIDQASFVGELFGDLHAEAERLRYALRPFDIWSRAGADDRTSC
jgi:hypothetical protein